VREQEGAETEDEPVTREHQQHVAHQRQPECEQEPVLDAVVIHLQRRRQAHEEQDGQRLTRVLQPLVRGRDSDPVAHREAGCYDEESPGARGHGRAVCSTALR
jgi:hypothetical protein